MPSFTSNLNEPNYRDYLCQLTKTPNNNINIWNEGTCHLSKLCEYRCVELNRKTEFGFIQFGFLCDDIHFSFRLLSLQSAYTLGFRYIGYGYTIHVNVFIHHLQIAFCIFFQCDKHFTYSIQFGIFTWISSLLRALVELCNSTPPLPPKFQATFETMTKRKSKWESRKWNISFSLMPIHTISTVANSKTHRECILITLLYIFIAILTQSSKNLRMISAAFYFFFIYCFSHFLFIFYFGTFHCVHIVWARCHFICLSNEY